MGFCAIRTLFFAACDGMKETRKVGGAFQGYQRPREKRTAPHMLQQKERSGWLA
jgi:hypothetical protein